VAAVAQHKQFGPFFDSSGNLYTLKIYHYAAGTTTLKDGYTTRTKSATVAQPLESDSAGIASAYWDGLYKFRIDGATDGVNFSTLYTYDNVAVVDQLYTAAGEGSELTAASTLTLGTDGNVFHVAGSTGITALSGNQARITLIFDSTPTITHSGSIFLQGGKDFTVSANDSMELVNDGSNVWREVSRTRAGVGTFATQSTMQASTAGTSISFTGIPTGVKRVTVSFAGVSTNGNDPLLIQIGDSGGIETSGYLGASNAVTNGGATAGANSTAGLLVYSVSGSNVIHGAAVFDLLDAATFSWVGRGNFALSNAATNITSACSKSLSAGGINLVTVTTTNGTNTFDNGTMNISWE
jgi:hypothetical protein